MSWEPKDLRNIALVGHRGVGKTSLCEAMLHAAGVTEQLGSVEEGTAVADFEQQERERQISISPALCHLEHRGAKINIIDCPGYSEFYVDALYGLWAVENALLTVDAVAGVEVHTIKMYEAAREMGVRVIGVVNKLDVERADLDGAVASMNESLPDCEAVAVQIPIGQGADFQGIVDLLSMTAYMSSGERAEVPAEMADEVEMARELLIDSVAASDDDLTMQYLEEGTLTEEELIGGLESAVREGLLVPVLCASATGETGITPLLDFVADAAVSPADAAPRVAMKGEEEVELSADPDGPLAIMVFKTLTDPYVGRVSLLRVVSGRAKADGDVYNTTSGERERLSSLGAAQARETEDVDELVAGDMGAAVRLEETATGDTLAGQGSEVQIPRPVTPEPMYAVAVTAASRADADKLSDALGRLTAEDMGLQYERNLETGELLVKGLGPMHLDVAVGKLRNQYDVDVSMSEPRVAYRETVRRGVRVQGRHKKQTGGRGQFADVSIRVEPMQRGEGFEFVDEIRGGSVPTQYIPAVEKGVVKQMERGYLAGYPIVDIRVTLEDGSSHPVDSSDIAFQTAAGMALRSAMEQAEPVLLEPIMNVTVTGPEDVMGDIMSDLNAKRGRILGTDQAGSLQVIKAQVPQSEMMRYAADLRSISQGRASYEMEFSHYEELPSHLAEQVIAEAKQREESDEE
ncbi:MAG: elongation factor G [Armatimonadota bacterium]|nr:elongation factor G [Armatimonadota bacterium]